MKTNYEKPIINLTEVKIEKGFASSVANESFGIQNFEDAGTGDNTAW